MTENDKLPIIINYVDIYHVILTNFYLLPFGLNKGIKTKLHTWKWWLDRNI